MADGKVTVDIDADAGKFEAKVRGLGKTAQAGLDSASGRESGSRVGEEFSQGVQAKTVALGSAVGGLLSDAFSKAFGSVGDAISGGISNSDAMEKFATSMDFAGFTEEQTSKASASLKTWADQTVFDISDEFGTAAKLASNGVADYEQLTEAAGNLTAVAGGGATEFSFFANALTQVNSAMVLHAQDWNQIQNAIPGAAGQIRQALYDQNAFTGSLSDFKDAMEKGEISAQELNQAIESLGFQDVARQAASSVTTFEGAVGNAQADIENGFQRMWEAANDGGRVTQLITDIGSGLSDALSRAGGAVSELLDAWDALDPGMQRFLTTAMAAAAATAALEGKFGLVTRAAEVASSGIGLVGTASEVAKGAVAGLRGALSGVAAGAGVAVAIALLGQLAESAAEAAERGERLSELSDGVAGSLARIGQADVEPQGLDALVDSVTSIADEAGAVADDVVSDFESVRKSQADLQTQFSALDSAVATIDELAGSCDGSAVKERELEAAVRLYNSTTGDSVEVTDRASGALSKSTGDIDANTKAWKENAKAQADQAAYQQLYEDLERAKAQTQALQDAYDEAKKAAEEFRSEHFVALDGGPLPGVDLNSGRDANKLAELKDAADAAGKAVEDNQAAIEGLQKSLDALGGELDSASTGTAGLVEAFDALGDSTQIARDYVDGVDLDGLAGSLDSLGVTADELADATEGDMWSIMRAWQDSGGSADALRGKLDELGIAWSEQADAAGGSADATADAAAGVSEAAEDVGALVGGFGSMAGASFEEVTGGLDDVTMGLNLAANAMQYASSSGGTLDSIASDVNSALKDAGIITNDLTGAQVLYAYETGMTGEALEAYAKACDAQNKAAKDATKSTQAAEKALQGARGTAKGATESVEGIGTGLDSTAQAANDAERAFQEFDREGGKLDDLTGQLNETLKDNGVITDDLTEQQALYAFTVGMTGDQLVEYARSCQEASDAQEQAAQAAADAQKAYEQGVETIQELEDTNYGLADILGGADASAFVDQLNASGVAVDDFKRAWDSLSEDPTKGPFSYDWISVDDLQRNLDTITQAYNDYHAGIDNYYNTVRQLDDEGQRERALAFGQWLETQPIETAAPILQQLEEDGYQNLDSLAQAYWDSLQARSSEAADKAYDGGKNVMGYGERGIEDGAEGVSQAAQDGAQGAVDAVTDTFESDRAEMHDSAREAGEGAAQGVSEGVDEGIASNPPSSQVFSDAMEKALETLPDEMQARGAVAMSSLGMGLSDSQGYAGDRLEDVLQSLYGRLDGATDQFGRKAGDAAAAYAGGLASSDASGAADAIDAAVTSALAGASDAAAGAGSQAGGDFAGSLASTAGVASSSASALSTAVGAALSTVPGATRAVGSQAGGDFAGALASCAGTSSSAAAALSAAVASALSGVPSATRSVGASAGGDFAGALASTAGVASSAAAAVAGGAEGAMSGVVGWMYGSGADAGANWAAGFRSTISSAVSSAASAASQIASYLHFSEPKRGALVGINDSGREMMSNYAASMMRGVPAVERASAAASAAAAFSARWSAPRRAWAGQALAAEASRARVTVINDNRVWHNERASVGDVRANDDQAIFRRVYDFATDMAFRGGA